ncbi:RdgB/HAM1 family non-canonical purine NTP pyrophosphatase [Akkermansia sp. N21169]|uniref:RdgB/HAM1 family non-canonical purine NTP pyrophosphatase n=1 Tax=Akkermansia sp. N21169 TaxID=3040765 RepID=UPI00244E5CD6|nr:RdgB/HAM1 family non-canonical purine NTP pyrophosphatase [Akkermansia sp. N21169]MDH3069523.1 RdgB/HAM1 family non-canonical purine NTP pyrophosphatase [Akkermansia sp. N21169]
MKPLLVIATRNAHKTDEIRAMLADSYEVRDLSSFPEAPSVEETGTTFLENATLKAVSASKCIPGIILADDSGIEVDALGGKPGVWSSSFGGEEGNHDKNNAFMISELKRVGADSSEKAAARFRCVMVLAKDGCVIAEFSGSVEGRMVAEKRGEGGFGYDPLFIPEGYDKTFAELPGDVKNSMSHRARALEKAVAWLASRS